MPKPFGAMPTGTGGGSAALLTVAAIPAVAIAVPLAIAIAVAVVVAAALVVALVPAFVLSDPPSVFSYVASAPLSTTTPVSVHFVVLIAEPRSRSWMARTSAAPST
jgi:hypothetical protein